METWMEGIIQATQNQKDPRFHLESMYSRVAFERCSGTYGSQIGMRAAALLMDGGKYVRQRPGARGAQRQALDTAGRTDYPGSADTSRANHPKGKSGCSCEVLS